MAEPVMTLRDSMTFPDVRQMNGLQLAYLGDTLHDLYVRARLLKKGYPVGKMHKLSVHLVSAAAQARMLEALEGVLTPEETDIVHKGRNAQAKHQAPRHASPADYSHATALEALWGYLYVTGQTVRLSELMDTALEHGEIQWDRL